MEKVTGSAEKGTLLEILVIMEDFCEVTVPCSVLNLKAIVGSGKSKKVI